MQFIGKSQANDRCLGWLTPTASQQSWVQLINKHGLSSKRFLEFLGFSQIGFKKGENITVSEYSAHSALWVVGFNLFSALASILLLQLAFVILIVLFLINSSCHYITVGLTELICLWKLERI